MGFQVSMDRIQNLVFCYRSKIYSYAKKTYLALGNLAKSMVWSILFAILKSKHFFQFSAEKIESINFAESSGLSCLDTENQP